jgi:hypothetical protein
MAETYDPQSSLYHVNDAREEEDYAAVSKSRLLQRMKGDSSSSYNHRRLDASSLSGVFSVKCRMTVVNFLFAVPESDVTTRSVEQVGCIPLDYTNHKELDLVLIMEIPEQVYARYRKGISIGTARLLFDHVMISADEETLYALDNQVSKLKASMHRGLSLVAPPPRVGSMSVFIVRVSASDASPNATLAQIQDRWFTSSLPNFASQYQQCSMNQLQFTLGGAMDIVVDAPILNFTTGMGIVTIAESLLRQATNVTSVALLADRILYCVAPGTADGWIASAAVNHWRAVFNEDWCLSLSGTMHELGHTLGLLHSGEDGNTYGDQTGYMVSLGRACTEKHCVS